MHPTTPIVGRKINFGLVGCGRISRNHIEAIKTHSEHAQIVAVCDTNEAALASAVASTGADGYTRYEDLLARQDVDAVVICTPSGLHPGQAVAAARAGKHVVSEKPMATRWGDGKRMVAACDEAGVHLFVVKQNRRNATLQLLKRAVEHGV